jgi:hypothetical protein
VVGSTFNRRRHERFMLAPMYTPVSLRLGSQTEFTRDGHCYDVSEGGVQFELDHPIDLGTAVEIKFELPGQVDEEARTVRAFANIVWIDDSEPGPVRMAATFTRFAHSGDRERLFSRITSGLLARAA